MLILQINNPNTTPMNNFQTSNVLLLDLLQTERDLESSQALIEALAGSSQIENYSYMKLTEIR